MHLDFCTLHLAIGTLHSALLHLALRIQAVVAINVCKIAVGINGSCNTDKP